MDKTPNVTWDDIAGLEHAKKTIQEAVTWPMLRPYVVAGAVIDLIDASEILFIISNIVIFSPD